MSKTSAQHDVHYSTGLDLDEATAQATAAYIRGELDQARQLERINRGLRDKLERINRELSLCHIESQSDGVTVASINTILLAVAQPGDADRADAIERAYKEGFSSGIATGEQFDPELDPYADWLRSDAAADYGVAGGG